MDIEIAIERLAEANDRWWHRYQFGDDEETYDPEEAAKERYDMYEDDYRGGWK